MNNELINECEIELQDIFKEIDNNTLINNLID